MNKQEDIYVKIYDDFAEQGLTLEQAYILGCVEYFNDRGLPYCESNKTLAKTMGISKSTVKRCIKELVRKGHLYKKTSKRRRILSIEPFNDGQNDLLLEEHNGRCARNFRINKRVHFRRK